MKSSERLKLARQSPDYINPYEIFSKAKWTCTHCKGACPVTLMGTKHKYSPTLDHIVPMAKGGKHLLSNIQVLCKMCNSSKGVDSIPKTKVLVTGVEKWKRESEIKLWVAKRDWVKYGRDIRDFVDNGNY